MQEAHGLIMDMMADSNLPSNVVSGLKTVSSLLSPPTSYNTLQRPKISPLVALSESCPGLRYLCISNCSHLTDLSLLSLAQHCNQARQPTS